MVPCSGRYLDFARWSGLRSIGHMGYFLTWNSLILTLPLSSRTYPLELLAEALRDSRVVRAVEVALRDAEIRRQFCVLRCLDVTVEEACIVPALLHDDCRSVVPKWECTLPPGVEPGRSPATDIGERRRSYHETDDADQNKNHAGRSTTALHTLSNLVLHPGAATLLHPDAATLAP